ncbi:MAG: polyprenyl synthetase family protein [Myxococcota bacterium]
MSDPPRTSSHKATASSDLFASVNEPLALVEHAIREQFESRADLVEILGEHVFGAGGKRLRPALLLLCAELCGYKGPRRVHLGAAIEMLHTATLLHDDVVDVSSLRRGRPSANAIWGNRRAVLAGDFFYARASSMVVEDGNPAILASFANTIRAMSEGELLQLEHSFDADVTEADYYRVIERKSASLLSTACEVGAVLGGVTRSEIHGVAEYGRQLGLAFQLRDDALDYEQGEDALGKRRYADLCEGKVTMPLLLTLKRADSAERTRVAQFVKTLVLRSDGEAPDSEADVVEREAVVALVARCRGVQDTDAKARVHAQRAIHAIEAFPDGEAHRSLCQAARFAVDRQL